MHNQEHKVLLDGAKGIADNRRMGSRTRRDNESLTDDEQQARTTKRIAETRDNLTAIKSNETKNHNKRTSPNL